MNLDWTQVTIDSINEFLHLSLPNGVLIVIFTFFFTLLFTAILFRALYEPKLKRLKAEHRSSERAVADLEAKEAQILEELDDLKKGEAILIHRNGSLDVKAQEYEKLCSEQEKLISALEENLKKRFPAK